MINFPSHITVGLITSAVGTIPLNNIRINVLQRASRFEISLVPDDFNRVLMMEAVSSSETSSTSTRLHGALSQKAVIVV
jgi:hypothetical protein